MHEAAAAELEHAPQRGHRSRHPQRPGRPARPRRAPAASRVRATERRRTARAGARAPSASPSPRGARNRKDPLFRARLRSLVRQPARDQHAPSPVTRRQAAVSGKEGIGEPQVPLRSLREELQQRCGAVVAPPQVEGPPQATCALCFSPIRLTEIWETLGVQHTRAFGPASSRVVLRATISSCPVHGLGFDPLLPTQRAGTSHPGPRAGMVRDAGSRSLPALRPGLQTDASQQPVGPIVPAVQGPGAPALAPRRAGDPRARGNGGSNGGLGIDPLIRNCPRCGRLLRASPHRGQGTWWRMRAACRSHYSVYHAGLGPREISLELDAIVSGRL